MIIGREQQRRRLHQLLEAASSGRADAVLLLGDAGIGKTVLLDDVAGDAAGRGFTVIDGTAVPTERSLPGAGVSLLARGLADTGGAGRPGAAAVPADARRSAPLADGPWLLGTLAAAAAEAPVLVVADDLQWWDEQSLDALLFAVRRLRHDRVGVAMAARPGLDPQRAAAAPEVLRLGPVEDEHALALARTAAPAIGADVSRRLWQAVDGNTLALVEVAARLTDDELSGRRPLPRHLPVGPAVASRWTTSLDELSGPAREALVLLAVAGAEEYGAVARSWSSVGATVEHLTEAERRRLVVSDGMRWRFRHPLVRHAVLESVQPEEVRRAHANLAAAVPGTTPVEVQARALHRAGALAGPDAATAQQLERDADVLRGWGATSGAVAVMELAARADPDPSRAADRLLAAAELAAADFDDPTTVRLGREGLELVGLGPARGRLLRVTGAAIARIESVDEGTRLVEEALALLEGEDRAGAARDLLFAGDLAADRGLEIPGLVDALGPVEDLPPLDRLLVAHHQVRVGGSQVRAAMLEAFGALAPDAVPEGGVPLETLVNAGLDVGLEISGPLIHEVIARLLASGDVGRRIDGLGVDSLLALYEGRWDACESSVAETVELCAATGRQDLYADALLLGIAARRGDAGSVARHHARAHEVMTAAGMEFWTAEMPGELAELELALGRIEEAVPGLRCSWEAPDPVLVAHTSFVDHIVHLVECLVDLGDDQEAASVARDLLRRLGDDRCALGDGMAARVRAALATDERADDLYTVAAERTATGVHVFELALVHYRHGRWLRRHRRRGAAVAQLLESLRLLESLGCTTWADRCRGELRAAGHDVVRLDRYDPRGLLTAQERRVAEAAASGLTNREVAARLFLSPRTVEVHLTHAFRKLGVRNRTALARALEPPPD